MAIQGHEPLPSQGSPDRFLALDELGSATIERAGALMAAQNVATRQLRPGNGAGLTPHRPGLLARPQLTCRASR